MKKFEYKTFVAKGLPHPTFLENLNFLGERGWQFSHLQVVRNKEIWLMMREKEND